MYTVYVIEGRGRDLEKEITKLLVAAHKKGIIKDWSERIFEPVKNFEDYLAGIFQGFSMAHSSRSKV